MSVQADIANTQSQLVREAVKKITPSNKDLWRLGQDNVAGVMTDENILKEIQVRKEKNNEKVAKKGSHTCKSAQKTIFFTSGPIPVTPQTPLKMDTAIVPPHHTKGQKRSPPPQSLY
ncbi:hypothetical protein K440DRAFT_644437 [Wilcoxina mikolae CBS 423.85]|nr:hypothetical protein K440DRAFT_644437 [Wilcoxina mikolae CBS 423.85]